MQEAYSQEVSSAGFWLGSKDFPQPVFYAYSYPTPITFSEQKVFPNESYYSPEMGEFFFNYNDVQKSNNSEQMLSDFLESTYKASAVSGNWKMEKLERNYKN